jgi:dihydroorotase
MQAMTQTLQLTRPDDWHLHLRDGDALRTVVPHSAAQFGRAIIMPNLRPPVTTTAAALAYRERIKAAVPPGMRFEPLMTLYLTDHLLPDEIARAQEAGIVAVKLYPAGATTHSDAGVTDLHKTYKTLEAMQRLGLPLLLHGEVTAPEVDIFDREAMFIDQQLIPLRHDFPELKIVFEHITTAEAVQYVQQADRFTAATVTAHHLLFNRNALFTSAGGAGLRPHYFCLPVLKREAHRLALLQAASSGSPKFFLGTDSAPHPAHLKENASCCAGCYTAHAAMEMYAQAFDSVAALDRLEAFASFNGADFYALPRNTGQITLKRDAWTAPKSFAFGDAELKPLRAGEVLPWRMTANP